MGSVDPATAVAQLADQRWRLNNLYWITDKEGVRVRFQLNWAQAELLEELHFLNLILKARQLGFTTFIQIYMLDVSLFHPDTRSGVIAQTKEDAAAIFRDKIKYPYDNLPDAIKAAVPIVRDNTTTLELANNSIISVGTSLRGGTLQYLHVSEFGKIAAKYPEKAREIVTGALNTIQAGQMAFIESTAEGQEGRFYEMCEEAQTRARMGEPLTMLDWKFHFFPWWREPAYTLANPQFVVVPPSLQTYFDKLRLEQGIALSAGQKAWYAKKAQTQHDDMRREYPSTPTEAFEASVEGAYYSAQMGQAETEGRVTTVPYAPQVLVDTWWDLGINDDMVIWFVQRVGLEVRVIDYYANSGEGLAHYAKVLNERGYAYGRHIAPHDIEAREIGSGKTRKEVAASLGIKFEVAPMLAVADGIEAVRNLLPRCWFDKTKCADGLRALKSYRKDWDENRAVWSSQPRHDWASHGADGFRTGAVSYKDAAPKVERRADPYRRPKRAGGSGWAR